MTNSSFDEFLKELQLSKVQLQQVYDSYLAQIELGLKKQTKNKADTKCFVTYVQDLPSGDELGQYLALDLGGTNFRVLLVTLKGHHDAEVQSQTYAIPTNIMVGTGEELFNHIADCLVRFVHEFALEDVYLPLGFTFSFPCTQVGLKCAILRRWTKGFDCTDVPGEDVGKLLKEAIERRGELHIDCVAVLNDTTGTLMSCAHRNPKCRIGVIIGTGSNICYVENAENIDMAIELKNKPYMLINTECGAFGDGGALDFIRTQYDHAVDYLTKNCRAQIFEKMISGMYLGEIVRHILLEMLRANVIFSSCENHFHMQTIITNEVNCFETRFLSEIEADLPPSYVNSRKILADVFGLQDVPAEECKKLQIVCECVSRRAAALIGTALSVLINKINEKEIIVGVDGSVYRFHPKFDAYIRETMQEFVKSHIKYDLMLSEDGSGRGAALVAAVASKNSDH